MKGAHSISTRRAYGVQRVLPGVAVRPLERLRAAAGDDVPDAVPAARAGRGRPGRRPGRPHPPGPRSLALSWRRVPESLGETPGRGDPHRAGTSAPVDAGARTSRPRTAWARRTGQRHTTARSPRRPLM